MFQLKEQETTPEKTVSKTETIYQGFPGGSVVKNPPANAGDTTSVPGSGKILCALEQHSQKINK